MIFKNIMVPYDGSEYSNNAYNVSLELSKKFGSSVRVVTCVYENYGGWYLDNRIGDIEFKKHEKIIQKKFENLKSMADKDKVQFSSEIIRSTQVAKTLVDDAGYNKIDLIVMGSHGRTGLDKLFIGSIANNVSQLARCSVLIVK